MDAIAFDDVVEYYMMSREQLLIQCDHESRKKRTLIKILSVLDFTGFSIARGHDSRFSQMLGVTSKLSEKMFPQLLGRTIFINVPQVFQWVFRLIKPLMSHRTVAKMVICPGASSGQSLAACPFTQHHLGVDNIPTFLGGTCRCNGGCCIGGVPNSQTTPINSVDADGLASISLSARTTQSLDYPVGADMHVSYNIIAEGKAIDVRAFISANGLTGDTKDAVALWECPMLQAADGVQAGTWVMPHDGILTLRIDNRHALFRGRSIKVKLDFVGRDESNVAQDDPLEMKRGGEGVDRVGVLAHPDSKDS
ncbi:hypothetical protein, variant [Aphanomyces invadans]|nr:hypothetical protein, variant [Aphanomyces invadans]ETW05449.1 hypothetical protein, variant [Aphanomyces invadans]|eukprot:XP_008865226.1 hypothetical protein, variant [Aphanomyces invadans]